MGTRRNNVAGYTLTEMLVVLLLLSLITAIGPVAINKLLPGAAVNSATRTLEADLEMLRTRALLAGREGQLRIESDGKKYIMLVADSIIRRRSLGNAVRVSAVSEAVYGDEDGIVMAGPDGRLSGLSLVLSRGSKTKQLDINPVFGTIDVVW